MEVTVRIKINSFPAWVITLDNGNKQFNVHTKDQVFKVTVKPKEFNVIEPRCRLRTLTALPLKCPYFRAYRQL